MKKLFCFTEDIRQDDEMYQYLEKMNSRQYEIHLYTNVCSQAMFPEQVWGCIEKEIQREKEDLAVFIKTLREYA